MHFFCVFDGHNADEWNGGEGGGGTRAWHRSAAAGRGNGGIPLEFTKCFGGKNTNNPNIGIIIMGRRKYICIMHNMY
jgi:hypothetical protein